MALIVTGHQRSGATLLVRLFNAHPHVRMTGEFGNFLEVGSPRGRYDRQLLKRWAGIVLRPTPLAVSFAGRGPWRDVVFQNNRFVLEYLRRLHGTGGQVVTAAVIEQVLKELLPGAKIVGDKYPEYIWGLDTLVGVEGLSTLVIYRDCRDVTASTLEKVRGEWRGRSHSSCGSWTRPRRWRDDGSARSSAWRRTRIGSSSCATRTW